MPISTFHTPQNGVRTTVTAPRSSGAPIVVAAGAPFGSTFPLIVCVYRSGVLLSILEVTGRSTNTLTISGAIESTTDVALLVGDVVQMDPTALAVTEIQTAVNALETLEATTVYTSGSYSNPAWITALAGSKVTGLATYDLLSTLTGTPVVITGATALSSSAYGKLHILTGTSADYTVTLPDPTGHANATIGFVGDAGLTKFVTLAHHASELIDGVATRITHAGEITGLRTDQTNWFKFFRQPIPLVATLKRTGGNFTVSSGYVNTNIPMDTQTLGPAAMFDSGGGQAVCVRAGNYDVIGFAYVSYSGSTGEAYIGVSINAGFFDNGYAHLFSDQTAGVIASTFPTVFSLAAGDTVNLSVALNGVTLAVSGSGGSAASLTLEEIPSW